MAAFFWRKPKREFAERVTPHISAQLGAAPALAAIGGISHLPDALAAIKGNAAHSRLLTSAQAASVLYRGDERTHVKAPDGPRCCGCGAGFDTGAVVVGYPVGWLHPETFKWLVHHVNFRQVLDPVSAVVARYDQLDRVAVEQRNFCAVHLVGDHDFAVHCVVHVD